MKRFLYLIVLMALGSSAHAGNSFSFVVGGHRIFIEAPRDCSSPSCVSVSIPGIHEMRHGHDSYDDIDDVPDAAAPAKPPAAGPQQAASSPIMPPVSKPAVEPVASAPPPSRAEPAKILTRIPTKIPAKTLPATPPVDTPADAAPPAPAPHAIQILQETDDEASDAPLGDWQTEGNTGMVRIERCGRALCGYMINRASNAGDGVQDSLQGGAQGSEQASVQSNARGDAVLINMKPKTASEWSGNIYSRDSGSTYYATMAIKGPDSLRVEACALGRFFCSGNVWSRIGGKPKKFVTSRQTSSAPRS